ncbi:MAG: class I SAM-dependent methyltransferase [Alphaproteobacteria bacterium]|nr:class I SAM-dependent methyltransferase [Alphaproteobacteria bacterium]
MHQVLQSCPELAALLEVGEIKGKSGSIRKISSMSTINNLEVLHNLCTQIRPKRTLEIGLAFGGSAMVLAASYRRRGIEPATQHTAIDPFQTSVWDDTGLIALQESGLRPYLDFRPVLSSVALPQLIAEGATFDLIYVDGSHLFEDVFVDLYFCTRLLTDGGIVAFDDSSDPHVNKVLRFIRSNCAFAYEAVDVGPLRADKGASLRYRFARAFGRVQLTAFRKIGPSARTWNSAFRNF